MKRFFKAISLLIMLIVLSVSATACTFMNDSSSGGGGNLPPQDTSALAQKVVFNQDDSNPASQTDLSLVDAIAKVERTSVAIFTSTGSGSGVIIDILDESKPKNDNYVYIITCHHVIEEKGVVQVNIPDENCGYDNTDYIFSGSIGNNTFINTEAVTLVGGDKDSDIALLRLDLSKPAKSGKILPLDKIVKAQVPETYSVKKGQQVFAIGNPSGSLPGSVADGIVSYIERETTVDEIGDMLLLQISVTTNPGSSGGGLYNLKGELIGITNAGNTSYNALNYAIPAVLSNGNGFIDMASQLLASQTDSNYGYISGRREKFGFTITETDDGAGGTYAYILEVTSGSQADSAGLKAEDKVVSITVGNNAKTNISTVSEFSTQMAKAQIGDEIVLNILRKKTNWTTIELEIKLQVKQYRFCDTGK